MFKDNCFLWLFVTNVTDAVSCRIHPLSLDSELLFNIIKLYESFLSFVVASYLLTHRCDMKLPVIFESIMINARLSFIKTCFSRLCAYLPESLLWAVKLHFNDMSVIIEWRFFSVVIFLEIILILPSSKGVRDNYPYSKQFSWDSRVFPRLLISMLTLSIFRILSCLRSVEIVRSWHAMLMFKSDCVNLVV